MDPADDPILPDRLTNDLASLYRAEVHVPSQVDRVITSGARAPFAQRGRWVRWAAAGVAVAAAVVVSIVLLRPAGERPQIARAPAATAGPVTVGDANGDGSVDIRDALSLARRIEAGPVTPSARDDVNADRVIDRRDVDAIAMMSVSLGGEVVR